jgi:hypothetical protein
VTTAVNGKKVDNNFYNAIKNNFCKRHNAALLVLPCDDTAAANNTTSEWALDSCLRDENIVFNDLSLNKNLFISSIKLSAKQINPLTGLSRIGQRSGSFIYANPKQYLEYVATSNSAKMPRSLMTTGAITKNDYHTERYMSQRTAYIAENDHVIGGIIVEIESNTIFHFRQVQANKNGSFRDLGTVYHSNGKISKEAPTLVMGDYHVGETDPIVKKSTKELIDLVKADTLIVHDFFNGESISHHDTNKPLKKAAKVMRGGGDLAKELKESAKELEELLGWVKGDIVMVKSNHDEFLERYLVEGRYVKDPVNHYTALKLAQRVLEGIDPLKAGMEEIGKFNDKSNQVIWMERDGSYKVADVECGSHGDLGANGAKGSLNSIEKAYGNCIVGHNHGAAIYRGVFRVGTSTHLKLDYNRGPSSWTNTHCLIYQDGSRQLINIIKGKFYLKGK